MSIATDVSRIKGNITAALSAIADKGVTVPDGSTSDALASLIASIEAGGGGGGLPEPFTALKTGTFTLASLNYCNAYPINHGLGVKPTIFALYNDVTVTSSGSVAFVFYINHSNANAEKYGGFCNSKGSSHGALGLEYFIVDENTFTLNSSTDYYGSNRQFRWVALG